MSHHFPHLKIRQIITPILTMVCSAVLSFIGIELAYRVYLFGWASFSVQKMNSMHDIGVAGILQPSPYAEIAFELKPNLRTYFKLAPFETNSAGLRDQEYAIAKPANTFRVAVIGDSFTMPSGVTIDEAYHSILEQRFNQTGEDGRQYEFINLGVGGYFLRQYWAVIKHKAQPYTPDLIIIGFCSMNDHNKPPRELFTQPYPVQPETSAMLTLFTVASAQRLWYAEPQTIKDDLRQLEMNDEKLQYIAEYFLKIGKLSRATQIPVVIAYLGMIPTDASAIEALARTHELYFVNVTLAFHGKKFQDYRLWSIDSHPNPKAHAVFANQIEAFLRQQRLIEKTTPGVMARLGTPAD